MFRLVTWNLKNFFDPRTGREEALTRLKVKAMGQALRDMRADVVCVQEVGSAAMLERLAMDWRPGGDAITRMGVADERGIASAILSRLPVEHAADHHPDSLPGGLRSPKRGAVHMRVRHQAGALDILCFHFKSRLSTFIGDPTLTGDQRSDLWRAAEAESLRCYAESLLAASSSKWLVMAGDANDELGFETLNRLAGQTFTNLVTQVPEAHRATVIHQGAAMTLDHMMVSEALRTRVREVRIHNEKLRDHGPLMGAAKLTLDSDHAALSAVFELTEITSSADC